MKSPKHSLRKIVTFINNPDEDGGFWLPNIQRAFVWKEDQVCRLFDSILRAYPISTLLIWKTKSPVRMRKFIDNYHPDPNLSNYFVPITNHKKCLVLDGQQRLQSLYIGLRGSYDDRELFFNILSGRIAAPDDVKYEFKFIEKSTANFPWLLFKELVYSDRTYPQETMHIIRQAPRELTESEQDRVAENVALVQKTFSDDDGISYQELDSIENTHLYGDEDVVEIFIRANSGGTKLGKSDLMFALLISAWEEAGEKIEDFLDTLNNSTGFVFERDLILKACLSLQDLGATYNVERFRTPDVKKYIETNWERIASSFSDVVDFIRGRTFIRCDSALLSYLAVIPLVYARYYFPKAWQSAKDVDVYLLRTLLCGVFGGHSDLAVNACVSAIKEARGFDCDAVFRAIRQENKPLELPEESLFKIGYGHKAIHLIFNLWYRNFQYTPAFSGNLPQVDHIFPQSALRRERAGSGMKYPKDVRDQLANCMLLTQAENGKGGKGETMPEDWFAGKGTDYLDMHLIPRDRSLWQIERFGDFVEARKQLIREKFAGII